LWRKVIASNRAHHIGCDASLVFGQQFNDSRYTADIRGNLCQELCGCTRAQAVELFDATLQTERDDKVKVNHGASKDGKRGP
jgi:hypothetical protein